MADGRGRGRGRGEESKLMSVYLAVVEGSYECVLGCDCKLAERDVQSEFTVLVGI